MGRWVFSGSCEQPPMVTGTNHKQSVMTSFDNRPTNEADTAKVQFSAVASLRPKTRWKAGEASSDQEVPGLMPAPIVARHSRGPRMKRSGQPIQIWSTKPLSVHPTAGKLAVPFRLQDVVGQIRNSLFIAHFGHSH
jgi:hypothetical protein